MLLMRIMTTVAVSPWPLCFLTLLLQFMQFILSPVGFVVAATAGGLMGFVVVVLWGVQCTQRWSDTIQSSPPFYAIIKRSSSCDDDN